MSSKELDWRGFTLDEKIALNNLNQKGLIFGVQSSPPWAYPCGLNNIDAKSCRYPGIAIEYTRQLCSRVHFKCIFQPITVDDLQPTLWSQSEDYQELMRQRLVVQGTINATLPVMVETDSNNNDLDFTTPMFFMEDGLLMRPLETESELVAQPFAGSIWVLLLAVFVWVAILDVFMRVVLAAAKRSTAYEHWPLIHSFVKRLAPDVRRQDPAWMVNFGIFIQRGVNINVSDWSRRVLYGTIGLTSIVLCGMYSAFLVSHRVATKPGVPISSLEELATRVQSGEYRLMIDAHAMQFLTQLRTSRHHAHTDSVFRHLGSILDEYPPILATNLTKAVQHVEHDTKPRSVLYSSKSVLRAVAKGNCNLTIVSVPVTNRGAFAFAKSPPAPPLARIFNKLTLSFRDFGDFIEQQEKKYKFGRNCMLARSNDNRGQGISSSNLIGLFYLMCFGCLLSVSALSLEFVYRYKLDSERSVVSRLAVASGHIAITPVSQPPTLNYNSGTSSPSTSHRSAPPSRNKVLRKTLRKRLAQGPLHGVIIVKRRQSHI